MKPIRNYIVVIPDSPDDLTKSGLIIPENAKKRPNTGIVYAVGNLVTDIKPNDKISYSKYAGTQFENEDVVCLIMRDSDVEYIMDEVQE